MALLPLTDILEYYEILPTGVVVSKRRGKPLKPKTKHDGYLEVHLSVKGRECNITVHRLVALVHIKNPLGLTEVNHKDFDRTNNDVSNLEWCNKHYNQQNRSISRITAKIADDIRNLYATGLYTQEALASAFKTDQSQISRIISGKRWRKDSGIAT